MFARLPLFALVTALGVILGANVLAQTSCQATYTVVSGDTCNAIASKFNVTDASLLAANPAVNAACSNLFIGQQLCIPPPAAPTCASQYTVKSGDVCISIANQFHLTVQQLESANPQINTDCSNLVSGEVLCIPSV